MKTAIIFSGFFYLEDTTCVPHKRHELLNFFFRKLHAYEHNVPRMLAKALQAFQTPGKKSLNHSNTQHCIQLWPEYLANIPQQSKLKHRCRSTTMPFRPAFSPRGFVATLWSPDAQPKTARTGTSSAWLHQVTVPSDQCFCSITGLSGLLSSLQMLSPGPSLYDTEDSKYLLLCIRTGRYGCDQVSCHINSE